MIWERCAIHRHEKLVGFGHYKKTQTSKQKTKPTNKTPNQPKNHKTKKKHQYPLSPSKTPPLIYLPLYSLNFALWIQLDPKTLKQNTAFHPISHLNPYKTHKFWLVLLWNHKAWTNFIQKRMWTFQWMWAGFPVCHDVLNQAGFFFCCTVFCMLCLETMSKHFQYLKFGGWLFFPVCSTSTKNLLHALSMCTAIVL